jgi:hypothetical protein
MLVEITAKEYVSTRQALEAAGSMHSATYNGKTITDIKALDTGDISLVLVGDQPVIASPTAPINVHFNDGIGALQSLVTELARARNASEAAAAQLKHAEAKWLSTEGATLKAVKGAADKREKSVYDLVRALAPVITKGSGESKPVIGVTVENFTGWVYDTAAALAWAIKRGAKAVALQLSPSQSPRLLTLLLDLMDYREKNAANMSPELAYLLGKIPEFLMLDTAEYEKLLKSGVYANDGIPGTQTTVPTATVDKDISFHLLETV